MRAPGGRRFAAGALASVVAVFGVLALRVHDGDDPALAAVKATPTTTNATSSSSDATGAATTTTTDPYDSGTSSSSNDSGSVSSTPRGSTSAS
ncbi:hypothetical protein DSM104299_04551 [Baekduia alba]|nr:hypothetical protein DSM104299_04551 [Baekduia alba]